jgi:hypothetical protein
MTWLTSALRREPLFGVALAGALLFIVIGIGLPLLGLRSFAGTDLLYQYEPYRSEAPTGFTPTNICVSDTVDAGIPATNEFVRRLHAGDFASWTSLGSGGFPLGSVPDVAVLSPISAPYLFLPAWLAPAYVKLLELTVCILGVFLFLRRLRLGRASAMLGGAIFASSGFMVVWTNWPQTRTAAFIPWLFWAIERHAQERRWTAAAPIAVVTSCLLFSGFPVVTGYALYAAVPYAILRSGVWDRAGRLREAFARLAAVAAAIAAGFALVAIQLFPFMSQYAAINSTRGQLAQQHLPPLTLATMLIPNALGSCGGGTNYFGPFNDIETNAFIGGAALVLVGLAFLRRPPLVVPRGVRAFFLAATALTLVLGWHGGRPLEFAAHFPVFSGNFVGRIRSVLGFFLAVLAAIGFENLLQRHHRRPRWAAVFETAGWVAGVVAVGFVVWRVQEASAGQTIVTPVRYVLPLVAVGVTLGVVTLVWKFGNRVVSIGKHSLQARTFLAALVPVMVVAESLAFVLPYWPRVPRDKFYPQTPVHRFLEENLHGDLFLATGGTILPGVNVYYGIATPNGHAFTQAAYGDMLRSIDPKVFRSVSYTLFQPYMPLHTATSPLLDRLGVKYLVVSLPEASYGTPEKIGNGRARIDVRPGGTAELAMPGGALRGVQLDVANTTSPRDPFARVAMDVLDDRGRVIASNSRRVYTGILPGPFLVPIAGENLGPSRPARIRIRFLSHDGVLHLFGSGSQPDATLIKPTNDGLRLVFANDVAVYQRLTALPSVRWASKAKVVSDKSARLNELANDPSNDDTVILDRPGPAGSGAPARVEMRGDARAGDTIDAHVTAQGDGYLVVAVALQKGLTATVDGKRRSVVPADHGLLAVPVPSGSHDVEIVYRAPHAGVALVVSLVTGLGLLGVGFVALRRRRHKADTLSATMSAEPAEPPVRVLD